eukprot:CAMPEP_0202473996 /NCGR_PEP_ID=MMETSP1360-20130828/92144_1 /ASSEMBLY_ACC=CAM_ASM_000848 /TAXON_ID=515479 /ORGANISM="Licmophora paradoxa, Strain CCMP2313" /LENGTH=539 /DNA_ID=CAMNT_0049101087 /DNA_START=121 /DNA_END=1741 /DNA_ORIENTATION=+
MSQSIRMLERRYRQSLRRKVPYRHFFTAAPSVWSGSIPQAMKNNLNQEVKTVPIIPHFGTPFPAVGDARNFAIMEQHDDAPTDVAVLGPKNVTLPKIDGIEDLDPSMQSIIQQLQQLQLQQQLQRQFSQQLESQRQQLKNDFQREISGIRQDRIVALIFLTVYHEPTNQNARKEAPTKSQTITHLSTAAQPSRSDTIRRAMKNNPQFSTPSPTVGHARNFAHDDAPTDVAVLQLQQQLQQQQQQLQQLQRQFSQQLESQRQNFDQKLELQQQQLESQRQNFDQKLELQQREISGIRQGLLPSTLYAFLEYTTKVYVSDNTDKPMTEKFHSEKEQKICCLLARASIAALLGNNSNKNWPSNRTVAALDMSRNEVICTSLQVAIHFCFAIGVYMKDWPPERNIVSHNGGFLKAFFPKIELRDCFSGPKPISSELPPLSEEIAMEIATISIKAFFPKIELRDCFRGPNTIPSGSPPLSEEKANKIATIINDRPWEQVDNVKAGLDRLAEILCTKCRLTAITEQEREQLAGLIISHYSMQESG